eukprot:CAMPEP_0117527038 /NCGR_PEP_ID=MMETSP0784-20121206/36593_1 /TAXON_ID=39447 /ORGANISM="" /LENGTH=52 /DNA_ID=CAMNT_0005323281 /DNA_START=12 /DNA_END=167 /DNA_ORIENTATION=+
MARFRFSRDFFFTPVETVVGKKSLARPQNMYWYSSSPSRAHVGTQQPEQARQ